MSSILLYDAPRPYVVCLLSPHPRRFPPVSLNYIFPLCLILQATLELFSSLLDLNDPWVLRQLVLKHLEDRTHLETVPDAERETNSERKTATSPAAAVAATDGSTFTSPTRLFLAEFPGAQKNELRYCTNGLPSWKLKGDSFPQLILTPCRRAINKRTNCCCRCRWRRRACFLCFLRVLPQVLPHRTSDQKRRKPLLLRVLPRESCRSWLMACLRRRCSRTT